ncbi:MAG: FxsA family protein [Nocardioidaceae bacterium]
MRYRLALLVGLFVALPILEIYVIISVGRAIGAIPTLLLLIAESILGGWLVKHEGKRAWNALTLALHTGTVPGKQLADAGLILVGGTLLLTPGFVTDVFGLFCVLPMTRPLARRLLNAVIAHRVVARAARPYSTKRGGVHRLYRDDDRS